MKWASILGTLAVAIVTIGGTQAQDKAKPNPAFAPVTDDPKLPRVLLIGDSISIGYTVPTQKLLAGKANVHRIPENGGPTITGLKKIDAWLGAGKWDVIHFNWGLHDIKLDADGKHQVELDAYEKNLRELVKKMRGTAAKLIWCSTTPVPDGKLNPPRKNSDVQAYNAAAKRIMEENKIVIDDLYSFAQPKLGEIQLPANVHYSEKGSAALAEQVSASVLAATGAKKVQAKPSPALVPIEDDPKLPRVLLIGDSISMGYTLPTRKLLAGKANVHRVPGNGGPTKKGIEKIDEWLGTGKWDVIHFNFGLHDIRRIDGEHQVPPDAYEKNLRELVKKMQGTGAKLIWASTTPAPEGVNVLRGNKEIEAYNAAAKKIMEENKIVIDDLYTFALPKLADLQIPANVHFTTKGSQALAEQVALSIQAALPKGKQ